MTGLEYQRLVPEEYLVFGTVCKTLVTNAPSSMLNFPKNGGDSRKLMKVQEPVQHFSEQCRHYVPEQNIIALLKTE